MKITKIVSLILACLMLVSAFSVYALALDDVNFIPELKSGRVYGASLKTPVVALGALYKKQSAQIYDKNGINVTASEDVYIGTGFTMKLDGKQFYRVVVMGDIDGDGKLTPVDYVIIKRAYSGTYTVNSLALAAAEVDDGEKLRPIHYIKVKRAYFGTYDINREYVCEPYDPNQGNDGWSDGWI